MAKILRIALAGLLFAGILSIVLADARQDLSIRKETNEERYTIYKLVNTGEKTIRAKIEATKRCSGVSNNQKPTVREYWVRSGSSVELSRAWPQSTCKRSYRIVAADYPDN
jgi:hypothetical protein